MKLDTKTVDHITTGCSCEIRFNKRSIWSNVETCGKDSYQARCFLTGLFGTYTELQYKFALSANLTGWKGDQTSSWFFMYDSEEVALRHLLKVENQNRSPSPRGHSSAQNSPSRSPPLLHHYYPNDGSSSPCINHRHQHFGQSSSPRNSPLVFRTSNTISTASSISPEDERRLFLSGFASSGISNHSPRGSLHQQDLNHSLVPPLSSPQILRTEPPDVSPTTLFLTPPTYEEATSQSP